MLKDLKKELQTTKNPLEKALGQYIVGLGQEVKEKTTLKGCAKAVTEKAKGQASGGCAMVEDAAVYSWAREYFGVAAGAPAGKLSQNPGKLPQNPGKLSQNPGEMSPPKNVTFLDFSLEDLL